MLLKITGNPEDALELRRAVPPTVTSVGAAPKVMLWLAGIVLLLIHWTVSVPLALSCADV
jgi:hypothetical protein